MSHDPKYEYEVRYFESHRGGDVAAETKRELTYWTGQGWELYQLNSSVVSEDNGIGSLMAMHSVFLTFRRPIE